MCSSYAGDAGGDARCATLYAVGCVLCSLEVLEVLEVIRFVLPFTLQGGLCLLEVTEMMRCVLGTLCAGGLALFRGFEVSGALLPLHGVWTASECVVWTRPICLRNCSKVHAKGMRQARISL